MKILVLNSGSSSQKACLYEVADVLPGSPPAPLWEGKIDWTGDGAAVSVKNRQGPVQKEILSLPSREGLVRHLLHSLDSGPTRVLNSLSEIDVVGHRVVHGGPHFADPVLVTREVRSAISDASVLAPLHIRAELEGIEIIDSLLGPVAQIAVFDTGFHRQMPLYAQTYPGPYDWFAKGIRRYGFHGINHEYCAERAAQLVGSDPRSLRIVTCHLGNGCSVAAIEDGRSIDTTMGFTPLEGLMMGTRSGSVDPGILIFLMREGKLNHEQMDHILNHESGLLGISGISSDMREILAAVKQGHERAKLAFDLFAHRVRTAIGAMAAALGGLDVLVFTAGVGENSAEVRAAICEKLEFLGLKIDPVFNQKPVLDSDVSTADSRARILVIRADEDWAIATECWKLIASSFANPVEA
jgi:acetate kinase